jgi:hypothetical protein
MGVGGTFLLWLVPVILVTFWLGARGLNADPLWGDERLSIYDAGGGPYEPRTLTQIWEGVTARNPWHAPGYFIVLSGWGRLVGWQPPSLRAMSLLFGVLGVACTYRLGRDMVSPRVGLIAAAAVGTSAFFVYYLHELRMYTLFVVLTAFTIWVYWRIVTGKREPHGLLWAGLLVGASGMLYTHYFASLPLFAIVLYNVLVQQWQPDYAGCGGRVFAHGARAGCVANVVFRPRYPGADSGRERRSARDDAHPNALSAGIVAAAGHNRGAGDYPLWAAAVATGAGSVAGDRAWRELESGLY